MNYRMIVYIVGHILRLEALLMIPVAGVALFYREYDALFPFLAVCAALAVAGFFLTYKKPAHTAIFAREGFLAVALAWILVSAFGAAPLALHPAMPGYVDCLFEMVSGFTTTGATIFPEVESLPRSILFWRCFSNAIGGMGVLIFILAVIPLAGGNSIHILRAETTGPNVRKLVPKMRSTAMILYGIYIALAIVEFFLLLLGGMEPFDSMVNTFSTAGTGGFAVKNLSIASYDGSYFQWVIAIFMLLFGVNFNLFYLILIGRARDAFKNEEVRCYFSIAAVSVIVIVLNIYSMYGNWGLSVRDAVFQVSSMLTTTGFSGTDYTLWPGLSRSVLTLLMFLGACAGSTGGGIKISRLIIAVKLAVREIGRMLRPNTVRSIKLNGRRVDDHVIGGVVVYLLTLAMLFALTLLLISFENLDFETTVSAVIACLNNIGAGFGAVGPAADFSAFSPFSKLVLSAVMLFGRLELFPMLMLLTPTVWLGRQHLNHESRN